jgi:hypothetical protein
MQGLVQGQMKVFFTSRIKRTKRYFFRPTLVLKRFDKLAINTILDTKGKFTRKGYKPFGDNPLPMNEKGRVEH